MTAGRPRFYDELAHCWPLFSPPSHYVEEAADLVSRLGPRPTTRRATLLEPAHISIDSSGRDIFTARPK